MATTAIPIIEGQTGYSSFDPGASPISNQQISYQGPIASNENVGIRTVPPAYGASNDNVIFKFWLSWMKWWIICFFFFFAFQKAAMPYAFQYEVNQDGNFFGHSQSSDDKNVVTGRYFVQLPDGRLQKVNYFKSRLHNRQNLIHLHYLLTIRHADQLLGWVSCRRVRLCRERAVRTASPAQRVQQCKQQRC